MNPFESSDPHYLARADERSLEVSRHELVVNCDDRREAVIDELQRRGTPIIATETVRLGRANRLSPQQIIAAGEEATANLAMRLRRPLNLRPITPLARELAQEAIRARAPEGARPPRLTSRPPDLREVRENPPVGPEKKPIPPAPRSIEAQLADALRRGKIKRNNPQTS
jgi:hypothetical protein